MAAVGVVSRLNQREDSSATVRRRLKIEKRMFKYPVALTTFLTWNNTWQVGRIAKEAVCTYKIQNYTNYPKKLIGRLNGIGGIVMLADAEFPRPGHVNQSEHSSKLSAPRIILSVDRISEDGE